MNGLTIPSLLSPYRQCVRSVLRVLFILGIVCSITAPAHSTDHTVTIGVLAYRGDEAARTMWSPTADYLSATVPGFSFAVVPLDFHEIGPAVKRSEVDFVLANTAIYVELEALYGITRIATLKNQGGKGAFTVFGGVIFCRNDRGDIQSLEDIKGKSFMAVDEDSLGGWRIAEREFRKKGIDPDHDFLSLAFGATHDRVVKAVLNHEVDAGTVRTDSLERLAAEGRIDLTMFRIINQQQVADFPFVVSSPLYPEWPFAKTRRTKDDLAQEVAIALLRMPPDSPAAKAGKITGWTTPLDYQPVHELMKELRMPPYQDYGKISLHDVLTRYWHVIASGLVLIVLMGFMLIYVIKLNRSLKQSRFSLEGTFDELQIEAKERMRAEEQLKKQNTFLLSSLEALTHPFYLIDATTHAIKLANKASGFGDYPKGTPCYQLTHHRQTPCDGDEHPCTLALAKKTKAPVMIEHIHFAPDGSEKNVEVHAYPIFDEQGEVSEIIEYSLDITERKKGERALTLAKLEAESANRAKSEFLANMSHEIRTPLNGIVGMVELAMDTALDDHQKNIFFTINNEVNSLLAIINDILDFSKIEAGRLELEEIPFNLRNLVEDVANSTALAAEKKHLEFLCYLSPALPPFVLGDPGRLRQVLKNLAGNSVKFTEKGVIFIKGELLNEEGDSIKIRFEVQDTGIGIAKEKQEDIFESFKQADGSTTRKYGGTGLGTAISKQLVELMGGGIGVESELGRGSSFWFTVTLRKSAGTLAQRQSGAVELKDKKVLIIDDSQTNRLILMEYFRSWGCLPEEAAGSLEALTLLRDRVKTREKPDLIVTDFHMPEMDGIELARRIRTMEALRNVPVIILTSAGNIGDTKQSREVGLAGYLNKPIRRDELLQAVELILAGVEFNKALPADPGPVTRPLLAYTFGHKRYRILLVEDYLTNQQVATRHLETAGLTVDLAENGQEAVAAFQRGGYDLILMDLQMPIMDGYGATRAIRQLEAQNTPPEQQPDSVPAPVPIIAMTAHATPQDQRACLEAGMDDYIAKPLRRKDFLAKVEKWLFRHEERQPGLETAPAAPWQASSVAPSSVAPSSASFDLTRAIKEFDNDRDFLFGVLKEFLQKGHTQIETIRQSLAEKNFEPAAREAHSIKGGAANLTADTLSGVAYELEQAARHGDAAAGSEVLTRLTLEFQRLEEAFQANCPQA